MRHGRPRTARRDLVHELPRAAALRRPLPEHPHDGHRLYFADYGLAISSAFELTPGEAAFLDDHRDYDRSYVATHLVNWLTVALHGYGPDERRAFVYSCAQGASPTGIPTALADLIVRDAPVAAVMGDFYRRFQRESRTIPYPLEAVRGRTWTGHRFSLAPQ